MNHFKQLVKTNVINKLVDKYAVEYKDSPTVYDKYLLKGSSATNFVYNIKSEKSIINKRADKYFDNDCQINFETIESTVFYNNLVMIDSLLPQILSYALVYRIQYKTNSISSLVNILKDKNPINFSRYHNINFYEYKIKNFLFETVLGMSPFNVWNGYHKGAGGYLVVKKNDNITCYQIYKRNEFETYLLNNTYLETPSSSRHNFGQIYIENNKIYFKLNLQIRFLQY